jgi:hypothetical protein
MKPTKPYLNESEAAEFLGVSAVQLRSLIRSHVTTEESDMSKVGITQFQPADLLLLRFLIGQSRGESVPEPGAGPLLEPADAAASPALELTVPAASFAGD